MLAVERHPSITSRVSTELEQPHVPPVPLQRGIRQNQIVGRDTSDASPRTTRTR